ncbi:hypothetical protein ACT3SY_15490 [Brachybacterium sp. AOP42-E1-35]|uniref:hypothetical protein n=1 Tax=Brachybacterium sp. AOP42-E1-35 TaxID=3457664 RepID=UPI00402A6586
MSDPQHRPTRRHLLGGGIAALAALPVASALGAPALADPVRPAAASLIDLGPALASVNVRSVAFGQLQDGRSVAYALSNGDPATLSVLDVLTGERIFGTEIPGAELGGFVTPGPDGLIYFTCRSPMKGGLFSLDPVSFEVTLIAEGISGQSVLYDGSFGPDGRLYMGTYPNARVLAYDPATGEIEDYGTQTEDAAYVFGLGVVDDEVWVGTGPVPHLFRIDIATGERTEMQPPAHVMEGTDWFTGIAQRGDLVFVRLSPRGTYDKAVYDQLTETWLEDIVEGTFDAAPTAVSRLNRVYYLQGDVLMAYDLRARRATSVGFEESALREELSGAVGTYGIAASEELPGLPQHTVVGLNTDGVLWTYSVRDGQGSAVIADVLASPAGAHSIGTGPDGAVYMGAYLSSGVIGRIDPDTEEIESLRGPKQADTIVAHGERLVVSSYPGAVAHIGDPSAEWEWPAFEQILELGRGAPNYQDRIFGITSVGDRLAMGSVPDYGQLGGALTLVDPATGEVEFHRDVVPQQSIVTLAHRDGLVYGGTSIHGGLSTSPAQDAAQLFIWDVAAASLLSAEEVVPGAKLIPEIAFGPDGLLWGLAGEGTVFAVDPSTGGVVHRIATGLSFGNSWGLLTSLFARESDGCLYAAGGNALLRIDPAAVTADVVVDGEVRYAALGGNDRIYLAGETNVYRLEE